jgi:hypothetical protein
VTISVQVKNNGVKGQVVVVGNIDKDGKKYPVRELQAGETHTTCVWKESGVYVEELEA